MIFLWRGCVNFLTTVTAVNTVWRGCMLFLTQFFCVGRFSDSFRLQDFFCGACRIFFADNLHDFFCGEVG